MGFSLTAMPRKFRAIKFRPKSNKTTFLVLAYWIIAYDWRYELYEGYEFRPWRLLLLIYSLFGIFGGLLLLTVKESPRFLLSARRDDEALEVIKWMYRTNKNRNNDDDFNILKLESEASQIAVRDEKGM